MSTPDEAENKAYAAANAISQQVGRLWMEAHATGVRNGMECGALLLDGAVTSLQEDASADTMLTPFVVGILENLRDQVRLMALQVPDPEVPSV